MINPKDSLLQRRNINKEYNNVEDENIWNGNLFDKEEDILQDVKEPTLNLMEEILLLGIKDTEGYTSFWNLGLSSVLRGCIRVELALRGKIELEKIRAKNKTLLDRKVAVKNYTSTSVALLDEALKRIEEWDGIENVKRWIEYLSGETWNPLKSCHHMKNVKERIAKNLEDKSVLSTDKTSFLLFDLTTHPLKDKRTRIKLVKKIQDALLVKWVDDPQRMDPRALCLLMLAGAAGVLDGALDLLDDEDFALATKRVAELEDMDMELEASRCRPAEIMYAVFASFSDITLSLPL